MQNLSGLKFGRLTVIEFHERKRKYKNGVVSGTMIFWKCKCDCGTHCSVEASRIRGFKTQSCGCLQRERAAKAKTIHGYACRNNSHPIYESWRAMKERCSNPKSCGWKYYGERGIKFDDSWKSFENFKNDMLPTWSEGMSLERKDFNGNYCKENCTWIPIGEQSKNTRANRRITFNGETMILKDWADKVGIHQTTIGSRLDNGWSVSEALFLKPRAFQRGK